jgi:hypothetical protein
LVKSGFRGVITYERVGSSYMKEVLASNDPVQMS